MKRLSPKSKIRSLRLFLITTLTIGALAVFYFSRPASAVNRTWDGGGGADHNWSNPLNWSGDTIPGSGDIALFDSTSTNDSTIDAGFAGSVAGIQINSGYTGSITQAAGVILTVGSSGYSQATGTFHRRRQRSQHQRHLYAFDRHSTRRAGRFLLAATSR
jgi:hypothetical protein